MTLFIVYGVGILALGASYPLWCEWAARKTRTPAPEWRRWEAEYPITSSEHFGLWCLIAVWPAWPMVATWLIVLEGIERGWSAYYRWLRG